MRIGLKGAFVLVSISLIALPLLGTAQESTIDSALEIAASDLTLTLIKMGYSSVELGNSKLRFERDLGGQCPTDRALSYSREIDIQNLNMASISEIMTQNSNNRTVVFFSIEPTEAYRNKAFPILAFVSKTRQDYPGSNWPFQVDENLPEIRQKFLQKFPASMNLNRWVSKTCFGESPSLFLVFRMSFDDYTILSEFRTALIRYANTIAKSNSPYYE